MFLGKYRLGETVTFPLVTQGTSGSAQDATTTPTYRVYRGSVAAGDSDGPVYTGTFVLRDATDTAGWYTGTIALTAGNGFTTNESYTIFTTGTIDGVTPATQFLFHIGSAVEYVSEPAAGEAYLSVEEARTYLPDVTMLTDDQIALLVALAQDTVESVTGQSFLPISEARVYNGTGRATLTVDPVLEVTGIRYRCCGGGSDGWGDTWVPGDVRIGRSGTMIALGNVVSSGLWPIRTNNVTLTYGDGGCGFPNGFQNVEVTALWGAHRTVPRMIKAAVGLLVKYAATCDNPSGVPSAALASENIAGDRSYQMRKIFEGAQTHGETGYPDVDAILARYQGIPRVSVT